MIDLLLEKYLTKTKWSDVYINPTMLDLKEMRTEGLTELRFFTYSGDLYVWDAAREIHDKVFNQVSKAKYKLRESEYDHPEVICGIAEIRNNKLKLLPALSDSGMVARYDELFPEYSEYFIK